MFRQSIFLGLMLVLGCVLIYLILSSRTAEKRMAARPTEIVRDSQPTPTRVISPPDLEIVTSGMEAFRTGDAPAAAFSVRHAVTVRSTARVPYGKLMLDAAYLSSGGTSFESRSHAVICTVSPGETVRLPEILAEHFTRRPAACRIRIAWADLAP